MNAVSLVPSVNSIENHTRNVFFTWKKLSFKYFSLNMKESEISKLANIN